MTERREPDVGASARASRVDLNRLRQVYDRSREAIASNPNFTMRAVAELDEDLHLVARIGRFTIESDEPVERGGGDTAPAPLHYFLAGVAFCLLTQIVKFSPIYDVPLADAQVDVRGEFSAAGKYELSQETSAFTRVAVVIKICSDAPAEAVRGLIEHAERGCHASQSIRSAVPISLRVALNEKPLAGLAASA
jgi:uncharacterized OsmC-like protein